MVTSVVEFEGGFLDGKVARSDNEDPNDRNNATNTFMMTGNGTIGKRIMMVSDAAIEALRTHGPENAVEMGFKMNHFYECVDRIDNETETIIRMKFIPDQPKKIA